MEAAACPRPFLPRIELRQYTAKNFLYREINYTVNLLAFHASHPLPRFGIGKNNPALPLQKYRNRQGIQNRPLLGGFRVLRKIQAHFIAGPFAVSPQSIFSRLLFLKQGVHPRETILFESDFIHRTRLHAAS
jgi:hypothetical protein